LGAPRLSVDSSLYKAVSTVADVNNDQTHHIIRYITIIFLILPSLWLQAQDHQLDQGTLLVSDSLLPQSEVQHKMDSIGSLPDHYLAKIDSLLQAKAQLLGSKISGLRSQTSGIAKGLDSISNTGELVNDPLNKLTPEQYTAKLNDINGALEQYQSKITDTEELAWVEHYTGQLDQMDGVVKQYQDKLLNLEELQALKGYSQQLQQLSQESSGYFKEMQDIIAGGLTDESPLMKQLESKIGHYPQFQELWSK